MHVEYSSKFIRSAARLPAKLIVLADAKEELFKEHPNHPGLKTHKLQGKEKDTWAFWINQKYRIKFIFLKEDTVLFLDIGDHSIYK